MSSTLLSPLFTEIAEYVNFGKDSNLTNSPTELTWATSNTILKRAPDAAQNNLETGTQWAEDSPTGPVKEGTIILPDPGDNTQYSRIFAWRVPRPFLLEKMVLNVGFTTNFSANAGNDCSFDSVDVRIRQILPTVRKNIYANRFATGHATLTGVGMQTYILEESLRFKTIIREGFLDFRFIINVTAGTATRQEGLLPLFSYHPQNDTKWFSQSGAYLQGRALQEDA